MARTESLEEQTKKAFQEDPRLAIFAGEGAATADLEMLALAKAKTNEGEDPRKIWRDTGWWKAKDGKWRFEIDDSAANIVDGQIVHAELEKAYPGVFDEIKVTVGPLEGNLLGSWNPSTKELQISSSLSLKDQLDTALHELQHYVQDREGFESGGNPLEMSLFRPFDRIEALKDKLFFEAWKDSAVLNELTTLKGKNKKEIAEDIKEKTGYSISNFIIEDDIFDPKFVLRDFFENATKKQAEVLVGRTINDETWSRMRSARHNDRYKNPFVQYMLETYKEKYPEEFSGIETAGDLLLYSSPSLTYSEGFDKYESVLGEAEARGVPVRKDMTPSQRRMSFPEDTYLLPEVGVGYEDTWTRPQFEPAFAEGGTVMPNTETQMNRLMQEGGIADDGMRRDPVSGNEIPPGSMATEVRDDIPAQLSEGEYVISADVLRYYGVAFFEKLRDKAKKGLAEMEQGGRIGGEPVDMEEGDDLPFDVSELQTSGDDTDMQMAAMGMAAGGIVKMQEGGMPPRSAFNPADWQTPGSTYLAAAEGQQPKTEYRVYQNAQGQILSILFINGVAQQDIPEGYFPQGEAPKVEQPAPTQQDDSGGGGGGEQAPQKSFNDYTAADWLSYKPDTGVGSTIGKIAGGVIGGALLGPAGAMIGGKMAEEGMARNSVNAYNALNDYVATLSRNDPNYGDLVDKRNKMYGDLTAAQQENPGFFGNLFNSIFGKPEITPPKTGTTVAGTGAARPSAAPPAAAPAAAPTTTGRDDKDEYTPPPAASAPVGGRGTGATATAGKAVSPTTGQGVTSRGVTALEGPEAGPAIRVAQDQKLGAGARGAAKGGLMMQKKAEPKKPTQKRKIKTVST